MSEEKRIEGSTVGGGVEMSGGSAFAGRDLLQYNFTFQVAPFRPPPDLAALRAAYTDYLVSAHRYLDFKGVPQVEKVAALLPLEEVFVPLHARPTAPEADTWRRLRLAGREMGQVEEAMHLEGMIAPVESAGPLPIDEALNKESALVILGDPGAGKSTLLKHLALHLARDEDGPLPILLPLNAYAEALRREEVGLQAYLARYYAARRKELEGIDPLFDTALSQGQAVVLLDGLDEVQERRLYVNRLVEDFVAAHSEQEGNRFVVASRVVGYRDAPLASMLGGRTWPVYTLTDWGREEIGHFAARWTLAFEVATHGDTPEARAAAEEERQDLLAAIVPGSGIERLASNPLLLTIMALIKRQRVTLPRERVKLYELYLETLISAWNKARALDKRPVGPGVSYLETVQVLAPLALWLREENPTAGLVSRERVEGWLTGYYRREWEEPRGPARQRARAFLESVRRYSNLLVERGEAQYGFLHLTFEEMLAAKGIALLEDQEGLGAAMEVICQHWLDPVWHETLLLTVGVLGIVKQSPFKAGRALRELCEEDLAGDHRGRNVVLAGEALADVGEAGADRGSAATVIARLVQVMRDRETPAPARRDAGHLLGRLGWEPEGGLDVWVEIPPGPFLYGDEKERRVIEVPYRIGAYPVTNKQFARFVGAGGYGHRACWSTEGWAWRAGAYDSKAPDYLKGWLSQRPPERRDRPYWWGDERLGSPLCPVVGIAWFEAQAYCRWLALEAGLDPDSPAAPRLPTEEEWERAVRGTDGRQYPWGDAWDRTRVNCADWWAGRELPEFEDLRKWWDSEEYKEADPIPTAVVIFSRGANPAGLWDGAGNVWEWTESWYSEGETRVLRGGSWGDFGRNVRCAYRYNALPDYFFFSSPLWGFEWSSLALGLLNPDFCFLTMKTYRNLYPQICTFENLFLAFRAAARGKRGKAEVAAFERELEPNLFRLQEELTTHTYQPSRYTHFSIRDPKPRVISAAPFRDRVVHHALVRAIEPIFERRFIHGSYACRVGKGTHRALDRCQEFARRYPYVLQCDLVHFFPSVDHAILRDILARLIADARTMWLVDRIIESGRHIPNRYPPPYFPGDDLFAATRPRGLPIGNLTSQFWANCYLNPLDQFIKRELKCRAYLRYVDDQLLFADDKRTLWECKTEIADFSIGLRLRLHDRESTVYPVTNGIPFLGFRVYPDRRRLKRRNGVAFARRFRALRARLAAGEITQEQLYQSVQGWLAHAAHGDTEGLRRALVTAHTIPRSSS